MTIIPAGPFKPDLSNINGEHTQTAYNCLPRGDGYGPWKTPVAFSQSALPATCRGYFYGRKTDGTIAVFAGTATKLYQLNNTTLGWTDVSLGAGSYTALATDANWSFAQFNSDIIAVHKNIAPQVFALGSATACATLGGSPPQASYVSTINRFVVLSGLLSNPFRIQWSGLNADTTWTSGVNSSDFQDLPDGGIVRGVGGGEYGVVLQETVIRRMIYQPGNPVIFVIEKITEDKGLMAPYSLIKGANQIMFLSQQGFQAMSPTGLPVPIGKDQVDRYFFSNYDNSALQLIVGAADPEAPRFYWMFKSQAGQTGFADQVLAYDYVLNKWSLLNSGASMEYIATLSAPGTTIEAMDKAAPGIISVTNAANNGSGSIRLTISGLTAGTAPSNTNLSIANTVEVYGITTGTIEANGNFRFNIIGTQTIDLIGSTFTHAYVSGGSIGGSLDQLTSSLDNIGLSALPKFSIMDNSNNLSFFSGSPLQATIDSSDFAPLDGRRVRVQGFRPFTDAANCVGSIGGRESLQTAITYSSPITVDDRGNIMANVSTRIARARTVIASGTVWTNFTGIEPDFKPEGKR